MKNMCLKFSYVFFSIIFGALPLYSAPITLGPGAHTIDTDTGAVDAIVSPDWSGASFDIDGLEIQAGATVTTSGIQPLIFNVNGGATIAGSIDISGGDGSDSQGCDSAGAAGGIGGPGGYDGGTGGGTIEINGEPGAGPGGGGGGGVTSSSTDDTAGGGGAGHLYDGSPGLTPDAGVPGSAGTLYASLPPLIGGSGGGGGSVEDDATGGSLDPGDDGGAGGGGGGGAIRIIATGLISVSGTIDASGGDGGVGNCGSGAGGGGSGGSIELISNTEMPTVTGTLDVSGGLGGDGEISDNDGGDASEGRVNILYEQPAAIPTLSEWGMILFTFLLAGSALWYIRQRNVSMDRF